MHSTAFATKVRNVSKSAFIILKASVIKSTIIKQISKTDAKQLGS